MVNQLNQVSVLIVCYFNVKYFFLFLKIRLYIMNILFEDIYSEFMSWLSFFSLLVNINSHKECIVCTKEVQLHRICKLDTCVSKYIGQNLFLNWILCLMQFLIMIYYAVIYLCGDECYIKFQNFGDSRMFLLYKFSVHATIFLMVIFLLPTSNGDLFCFYIFGKYF